MGESMNSLNEAKCKVSVKEKDQQNYKKWNLTNVNYNSFNLLSWQKINVMSNNWCVRNYKEKKISCLENMTRDFLL
jgi:hypothetical protein